MIQPFDDTILMAELKAMEDNLTEVPVLDAETLLQEKSTLNREINELQDVVANESRLSDGKTRSAL